MDRPPPLITLSMAPRVSNPLRLPLCSITCFNPPPHPPPPLPPSLRSETSGPPQASGRTAAVAVVEIVPLWGAAGRVWARKGIALCIAPWTARRAAPPPSLRPRRPRLWASRRRHKKHSPSAPYLRLQCAPLPRQPPPPLPRPRPPSQLREASGPRRPPAGRHPPRPEISAAPTMAAAVAVCLVRCCPRPSRPRPWWRRRLS